jgi:tRNA (mo5U34)-methyltransferase
MDEIFLARRRLNFGRELVQKKGWYHSVDLLDGTVTDGLISIERLERRVAHMPIPADLRGKRVLDIGAWDGWFSFEMERRGADVVAVDCVEIENFLYAHDARKSRVDYRILDVMELTPRELGYFDIVLFLGVLYHLKHPLIGLEKVCELTRDLAIVESYTADDPTAIANYPRMEFYEHDELGEQLDNWFGPSVECLLGLCRTAGFARVDLKDVSDERATVACYRKWADAAAQPTDAPPKLNGALHYRNYGKNFYTNRDDYVSCWFSSSGAKPTRDTVYPEVGGFGVQPMDVRKFDEEQSVATFKLPPGLAPGVHEVRIRTAGSPYSNTVRISVDVPPVCDRLTIESVCDGRTWSRDTVTSGFLSVWITGLPDNADQGNIRVLVDGRSQVTLFVGEPDENGARQVNVSLRAMVRSGAHEISVEVGGTRSNAVNMTVAREQ